LKYREINSFSNMSDVASKNVTTVVGVKDEGKDVTAPFTNGTKAVKESGGLPLMQVRT
jgi:seryl-tRNA synthetase